ncbi:MAG TPA: SUMF1/EgtB/PvdO family nonheme iron enzyme, partial [Thermotogota bacterium]|nr:SUMF1/EgtB/PvdO family nonheme iron enzyme [Thermotogota bacterium]
SEPDGAEIWRNEKKLGSTPLTLDLPAGTYTLEARKEGYITQAQEVELGGGQEKDFERVPSAQTLHFVLERRTGKVTITTQPNDAKIIIEKVFRANGSYTYEGPEGTILVQVEKEGYKSQLQSFQVEAGKENSLRVTLEKEPPVTGTLRIINPDKNSVYIDGVFAGWDEEYKKPVQPGSHTVDYKASGKTVSKVEISIKAGQEVVVQKNKPVPTPSDDPNPPPSPSSIPIPEGMVKVERGTYPVGTSTVALSCGFLIAKTEVTFAEYDAYCIATGKAKPSDANWGRKEQPVINVSWKEAAAYCNWLSKKEGYAPAYDESTWGLLDASGNPTTDIASVQGYRLPTEAEWEVAASGGQNRDQVHKFAGNDLIDKVAWHHGNSGEWVTETIKTFWEEKKVTVMKNHHAHPVGKKDPNELGLYDMSGNVYEWCHDWYGEQFPASSSDPTGPSSGVYRVIRGGSWFAGATACEVSSRGTMNADIRNSETGFRVAQTHE